jgi:hypothetical protein
MKLLTTRCSHFAFPKHKTCTFVLAARQTNNIIKTFSTSYKITIFFYQLFSIQMEVSSNNFTMSLAGQLPLRRKPIPSLHRNRNRPDRPSTYPHLSYLFQKSGSSRPVTPLSFHGPLQPPINSVSAHRIIILLAHLTLQ